MAGKARRGPVEIYRDVLLGVAMAENYTEKPTRIMYKSNLSWAPLNKILARMVEFGMLDLLDSTGNPVSERVAPDNRRIPKHDRRSTYLYRVSKKGFVILRIMDLLFEYVEAASNVNVPPAIMRIIARTSGYGHGQSFDAVITEMIKDELPKLLFDPVPEAEEEKVMEDLSVAKSFTAPRSLDARIVDAGLEQMEEIDDQVILTPVDRIPEETSDNNVYVTEKTFDGMFKCPVCGRPAPSEKAIIKHVKIHHGRKALIAVA